MVGFFSPGVTVQFAGSAECRGRRGGRLLIRIMDATFLGLYMAVDQSLLGTNLWEDEARGFLRVLGF